MIRGLLVALLLLAIAKTLPADDLVTAPPVYIALVRECLRQSFIQATSILQFRVGKCIMSLWKPTFLVLQMLL